MTRKIDIQESNFDFGDHRWWGFKEREAWHSWYEKTTGEKFPMEGCCDDKENK